MRIAIKMYNNCVIMPDHNLLVPSNDSCADPRDPVNEWFHDHSSQSAVEIWAKVWPHVTCYP